MILHMDRQAHSTVMRAPMVPVKDKINRHYRYQP